MKYQVRVTQYDIRVGERDRCKSCPVAHATRRALDKKLANVLVHGDVGSGWCRKTQVLVEWRWPSEVRTFIARFDARRYVEPFTFELELPL